MVDKIEVGEAFHLIVQLYDATDGSPLNEYDGAWVYRIDGSWTVAINGHDSAVHVGPDKSMDFDLPPYHMAVWYNGWIAGLVTPDGGSMAAGEGANEDTLIEALKAKLAETKNA